MSGNNPDEDLVVIKPRPGELLINDDDIISKIRELGKNSCHRAYLLSNEKLRRRIAIGFIARNSIFKWSSL